MHELVDNVSRIRPGRIAVYGTGGRAGELADALAASRPDVEVAFFLDSFKAGSFHGKPVLRFDAADGDRLASVDEIIVASTHVEAITTNLRARGVEQFRVYDDTLLTLLADAVLPLLSDEERFTILDVGARNFDKTFAQDWRGMPASRLRLYGFDPDPDECARMRGVLAGLGVEGDFFAGACWSRAGEIPFYASQPLELSSCLPPSGEAMSRLRFTPRGKVSCVRERMRTLRLDDWAADHASVAVDYANLVCREGGLRSCAVEKGCSPKPCARKSRSGFRNCTKDVPCSRILTHSYVPWAFVSSPWT